MFHVLDLQVLEIEIAKNEVHSQQEASNNVFEDTKQDMKK